MKQSIDKCKTSCGNVCFKCVDQCMCGVIMAVGSMLIYVFV